MTHTKDEALKLALEALESSDKLINGSGNHFGLEGAMDGYYSGCFDVDGNNKLLNEAITAIKEALAQPEQPADLHNRLADLHLYEEIAEHYAKCAISPEALRDWVAERVNAQPEERNFCPRCGKRTADLTAIHTCTPPQENT
jgi:hypothetical protein